MPCVSGRESQSPGSLLQVNSPENIHTIYTEYTVYLHVLIKKINKKNCSCLIWSDQVQAHAAPVLKLVLHCAIQHPNGGMGSPP